MRFGLKWEDVVFSPLSWCVVSACVFTRCMVGEFAIGTDFRLTSFVEEFFTKGAVQIGGSDVFNGLVDEIDDFNVVVGNGEEGGK